MQVLFGDNDILEKRGQIVELIERKGNGINRKEKYLFYNIEDNDLNYFFEIVNDLLNKKKISKIVFATPFYDASKIYRLSQLLYNANIYNVYQGMVLDGHVFNIRSIWDEKPILDYLEVEVTNKCNLRCKGCSHFICIDDSNPDDIESYYNDIKCLSTKYSNISAIRLLGGEPLLSKELGKYISITYKYFPNSDIWIVTNGILINKISSDLIKVIQDFSVSFSVSLYPQFFYMRNEIISWFEKNRIDYRINDSMMFFKYLSKQKNESAERVQENCYQRNCHFLRKGKISKCPLPLIIARLNNKFGTKYPTTDYVDIYSNISAWEINKFLFSTTQLCEYCLQIPEHFICRQLKSSADISLNDWVQ